VFTLEDGPMNGFQFGSEPGIEELPSFLAFCSNGKTVHHYRWINYTDAYRWVGTCKSDAIRDVVSDSPIVRCVVGFMEEGNNFQNAIQLVADHVVREYLMYRACEAGGSKLKKVVRRTYLGGDHPYYVACGEPLSVEELPDTFADNSVLGEYVHMLMGMCRSSRLKYREVFDAAEEAALQAF
jgi:hypothetical protein